MRVQDVRAVPGGKQLPVPVSAVAEDLFRRRDYLVEAEVLIPRRHICDVHVDEARDAVGIEVVEALCDARAL